MEISHLSAHSMIVDALLDQGVAVELLGGYVDFLELEGNADDLVHATGTALVRSFPTPLSDIDKSAAKAQWEGMKGRGSARDLGTQGPYGRFVRVGFVMCLSGDDITPDSLQEVIARCEKDGIDLLLILTSSDHQVALPPQSKSTVALVSVRIGFSFLSQS